MVEARLADADDEADSRRLDDSELDMSDIFSTFATVSCDSDCSAGRLVLRTNNDDDAEPGPDGVIRPLSGVICLACAAGG